MKSSYPHLPKGLSPVTDRKLESLIAYAQGLAQKSGMTIRHGSIFAKVLTRNDDSGRHGVLIPTEVYEFFPDLRIPDPSVNATTHFQSFDCVGNRSEELAFKYYQRYPERRITCLNSKFSDRDHGLRLGIFFKGQRSDGTTCYYTDAVIEHHDAEFSRLCSLAFGDEVTIAEGAFVLREIGTGDFASDDALDDLLERFDAIRDSGWIDSRRTGTTGIGHTFESLVGVKENNDQRADFRGIEIKCSLIKGPGDTGGKINLFQKVPRWVNRIRSIERIRLIGQQGEDGRFKCHSQVTTSENNLGLWLREDRLSQKIDLLKDQIAIGDWQFAVLAKRLLEKHSRAVFVKGKVAESAGKQRFHYQELVYCEQPSIERFVELVRGRRIVFEFLMSEEDRGHVRNHGYPWRLLNASSLSDLFALRIRLR